MSHTNIHNTVPHGSYETMGRWLMVALSILAASPVAIGLWAALTGGGF